MVVLTDDWEYKKELEVKHVSVKKGWVQIATHLDTILAASSR